VTDPFRLTRFVLSFVVLALVSGCISRTHRPYRPELYIKKVVARDVGFELDPDLGSPIEARPLASKASLEADGHRALALRTSSVGRNNQPGNRVEAVYYQASAPGPHRLIVVLPIWGASEYPSRKTAHQLLRGAAGEHTHVLLVRGPENLLDWQAIGAAATEEAWRTQVQRASASLASTVIDVRRLVHWAAHRPEVDARRIGIVGFSVGAIAASLVMGQDPLISTGAFVMGGANPHQILATCRGKAATAREPVLARFGWTVEEYEEQLEPYFEGVNPVRYAGTIHPRDVLVIDASVDHCIPETAREDFWEAMGRPERISLAYGHKTAFLSMTPLGFGYTWRRVTEFLDRRLPPGEPAGGALLSSTAPVGAGDPASLAEAVDRPE